MFSDPPADASYAGEASLKIDAALEAELEDLEAELEAQLKD